MAKLFHFFLFVFLLLSSNCFAQIGPPHVTTTDTVRTIEIIHGNSLREKSLDSVNKLETIAGNVLISERTTKFSCDSAIINRKENTIEAFGNVHINDADSLHTYSQYLKYFGDKRLAHLTKNVKLTDKKGILLTQTLDYDLAAGVGTYHNGGKVINGSTVLTSNDGIYYADTKDVYFKNNVDLVDPKYKIKADSLLYNTQTQIVTFIGPTNIKSKEATTYTTQGTYDLKNGNAFFGTRSLVTDSSRRIYQADRIAIDEKSGLAELEGRAIIKDSTNGVVVTANHIYLNNKNSSFLAVNKPVMIIQRDNDSTYIAADTLFSGFMNMHEENIQPEKNDSVKKDLPPGNFLPPIISKPDSINSSLSKFDTSLNENVKVSSPIKNLQQDTLSKEKILVKKDSMIVVADSSQQKSSQQNNSFNNSFATDTLKGTKAIDLNKPDSAVRYFIAFHHVRVFNDSLQSVCDSLFFSAKDFLFRLFRDPVVWSAQSQVTGDTIYLYTKNKKPEHIYVFNNGMVVSKSKGTFYNQIAGKTINGYFKDGQIDYARVKGQKAESIYYVQDRDSAYIGMNSSTGDVIDMFFLSGGINKVKLINDVQGTMYPIKKIPDHKKFLKNFKWLDKRRPKNKLELFE